MGSLPMGGLHGGMTNDTVLNVSLLTKALPLGAAVGCATVGGVMFGFSSFVMAGLARLPAPQGIAAMQSINITAVRPAFMTVLLGTATPGYTSPAMLPSGGRIHLKVAIGGVMGTVTLTRSTVAPRPAADRTTA